MAYRVKTRTYTTKDIKNIPAVKCGNKTRAPHTVPTLVCQGPSFYLKYKLKRDITPDT